MHQLGLPRIHGFISAYDVFSGEIAVIFLILNPLTWIILQNLQPIKSSNIIIRAFVAIK